jgi:hypothetical protein
MLIGDSRAKQYIETLAGIAKLGSWNLSVWTQYGCRLVLTDSKIFQYDRSCVETNQRIFN